MKKTIRDFDIKNKKVLIRVDFNVPIKDGKIIDDNRIRQSLETIKFAIEQNAKVILLSHLGRIKTEEDLKKYSLKVVADRLSELLNKKVIFVKKKTYNIIKPKKQKRFQKRTNYNKNYNINVTSARVKRQQNLTKRQKNSIIKMLPKRR